MDLQQTFPLEVGFKEQEKMGLYDEFCFQQPVEKSGYAQGIVLGIVKDNYDKEHPGMVKVNYILGEEGQTESDWIRVLSPYAGKQFGQYFLPEIGTEVLVGFIGNMLDSPVILGCLYNEEDKQPDNVVSEKNDKKIIHTKGGIQILFSEEEKKERITITTPKELKLELQDEKELITITDKTGKNAIKIDSKNGIIQLEAEKKIVLKAGSDTLTLEGNKGVECKSSGGKFIADVSDIELKAKANVKMSANASIEAKANATLKMTTSGQAVLKGSITQIN